MLQLERILQSQGFGSRKQCRELVLAGQVCVDGVVSSDPQGRHDPIGLPITVLGNDWICREKIYLALNKPAAFECSQSPQHHASVYSLIPDFLRNRGVQCIGRLDADTTGLLLMSDDGQFNHALASPKKHVNKTYIATTKHPISEMQVQALLSGVLLRDEPEAITAMGARIRSSHELEMTIDQGKYHQVKRMVAAAGNRVETLHRIAIGNLTLDDLPSLEARTWCLLDAFLLEKLR